MSFEIWQRKYSSHTRQRKPRCRRLKGRDVLVSVHPQNLDLHLWVENDIAGRPLTDPIFEQINQCDVLFADVTTVNFNVTFEIGYAIGRKKARLHYTGMRTFRRETELIDKIGIFDTLGFDYVLERGKPGVHASSEPAPTARSGWLQY